MTAQAHCQNVGIVLNVCEMRQRGSPSPVHGVIMHKSVTGDCLPACLPAVEMHLKGVGSYLIGVTLCIGPCHLIQMLEFYLLLEGALRM